MMSIMLQQDSMDLSNTRLVIVTQSVQVGVDHTKHMLDVKNVQVKKLEV